MEEILTIKYESGYMRLVIRLFFPCPLYISRKIFPLIRKYCTDEDKINLFNYLNEAAAEYEKEGKTMLYKRAKRNIGFFAGEKDGKCK